MAVPAVVWILGAGLAVFALSRGTKKPKKTAEVAAKGVTHRLPAGLTVAAVGRRPVGDFTPGESCRTGLPDVFSAYNEDGDCIIFYDYAQDAEKMREHVLQADEEAGHPDFCDDDIYITEHKGTFLEKTYLNPVIVWIAHTAITSMYGTVDPSAWPPLEEDSGGRSPYWIEITWQIAVNTVLEEICGIDTTPII